MLGASRAGSRPGRPASLEPSCPTPFSLRKTRLGRAVYFTGDNPEAAKLIGLDTRRIRLGAFVLSGFMAALGGLFSTAHMGMANRYLGTELKMNIIIACLVGGGSITHRRVLSEASYQDSYQISAQRAGDLERGSGSHSRKQRLTANMERAKGIEPSYAAWEAAVLPLNYARPRLKA